MDCLDNWHALQSVGRTFVVRGHDLKTQSRIQNRTKKDIVYVLCVAKVGSPLWWRRMEKNRQGLNLRHFKFGFKNQVQDNFTVTWKTRQVQMTPILFSTYRDNAKTRQGRNFVDGLLLSDENHVARCQWFDKQI